jgi:hypothetical protein
MVSRICSAKVRPATTVVWLGGRTQTLSSDDCVRPERTVGQLL